MYRFNYNENLKIKYFPNVLTENVFFKFSTAKTVSTLNISYM